MSVAVSTDSQAAFGLCEHCLAEEIAAHKGIGKSPGQSMSLPEELRKGQMVGYSYDGVGFLVGPGKVLGETVGQEASGVLVGKGPFDPFSVHPAGRYGSGLRRDIRAVLEQVGIFFQSGSGSRGELILVESHWNAKVPVAE